jgi:hypothetical protein
MDVTLKTTVLTNEHPDVVAWKLAEGLADLCRSLEYETGPRGITSKVIGTPASVVRLDQEVPA